MKEPVINYKCSSCDTEIHHFGGRPDNGLIGNKCIKCGVDNLIFVEESVWNNIDKSFRSIFVEL